MKTEIKGSSGIAGVTEKILGRRSLPTQETQGYESNLAFWGGTLKDDPTGKKVLDMRPGFDKPIDTIDRFGDRRVRSAEDHGANAELFRRNAGRVWRRRVDGVLEALKIKSKSNEQKQMDATWAKNKHKWDEKESAQKLAPRSLLKLAAEGYAKGYAARYRGTPEEITNNINRLGLQEYYGPHQWGIELKKPEIFTNGISLYDVFLAESKGKEPLIGIDRNQAVGEAAKYLRQVHDMHGAVGEFLIFDVQFQRKEGNNVYNPVLGVPDIVWNKDTTMTETTKRATDVLDFLVNVAFWERKIGTQPEAIQKELDTILDSYGDLQVIQAVRAFINPDRKSKKMTLPGEENSGMRFPSTEHSKTRVGAEKQWAEDVRQEVFNAAEKYTSTHKTTPQPSTT